MQPTTQQYNPEEEVTLSWKDGRVKHVRRADLPTYNLPTDYESGSDTYAKQVMAGVIAPNDSNIPEKYRTGVNQKLLRSGFTSQSVQELKDKQARAKVKEVIKGTANEVLKVINNKDTYATNKDYQDALNYAVSDYNKRAFEEGGKQLTGAEKGMISGTQINQAAQKGPLQDRIAAFFTGSQPPEYSIVADPEKTIENKMNKALEAAGVKVSKEKPKQEQKSTSDKGIPERLATGAVENIAGLVKSLPSMSKATAPVFGGGLKEYAQAGIDTLKGLGETALAMTGGQIEDGQASFSPQRALDYAIDNPVNTLAMGLPAIKGKTKATPVVAEKPPATVAPKVLVAPKTSVPSDVAGRAATTVAVPDMTSVAKSEKVMSDALLTTDSVTRRGMAKELEGNISKVGENIDKYAKDLDRTIGGQPLDDVFGTIDNNLSTASPVQAYPDEYRVVRNMVEKDLRGGVLPDGSPGTTIEKMNTARKNLNQSIPSSWFDGGMKTSSRADVINAIKWDMSNQLRNLMAEADKTTGYFNRALEIQHTAYQAAPALSREALTNSSKGLGWYGIVHSAWEKASSIPKVMGARELQGARDPLTQQILSGQTPTVAGQSAQPLLQQMPAIQNKAPFETKAPAPVKSTSQSTKLVRDKRYKTGNPKYK